MADVAHKQTDKLLADLEKKITREYSIAQRDIQNKLKEWYKKYEAEDKEKQNAVLRGDISKKEYIDWRNRHLAMGERWRDMRDSLAHDYHNINQIAKKMVFDSQKEVYALNHNYGTYEVEHAGKLDTSYTLYDRATVERILKDDPKLFHDPGTKKAREIAKNKDLRWNTQKVNSAVLQGILQGEPISKIADRLQSVALMNRNAAIRDARTSMTGAQNAGRIDAYKRAEGMGIELLKEWVATLDNRTRHEHRLLHGEHAPIDEPFEVEGNTIMFPGDPDAVGFLVYNCRCTLKGQIKGYETDRIKSSPKMGGMTFEEWQHAKEKKQ